MSAKKDPELYRRMSEPFKDADTANAALTAFFEELYTLREKHRIANVHAIASIAILDGEGNEGDSVARYHIGDPLRAEGMTAYAFGAEQAERESLIVHLVAQGKKRGKKS